MAPVKIRRDEYEEKYYIPKQWMYGQIIGKKGRTLEQIKERSGLHHIYMDINHGSVQSFYFMFTLSQVLLTCWRSEIDQTWQRSDQRTSELAESGPNRHCRGGATEECTDKD